MSIITRVLRQDAVYWAPSTVRGYDGNTSGFSAPVAVRVRWSVQERFHVLETGVQVISQSSVMINQDVLKEGYLYLGELADVIAVTDPTDHNEAWEIMKFDKIPNFRATEYLRTAYLTWQK